MIQKHEPHFACAGCADLQSLPADHLRTHGGELWCDECWHGLDKDTDTGIEHSDLPQFIPEADLKIQALERERNELAAQVERLLDVLKNLQSTVEYADNGEGCYIAGGDLMIANDRIASETPPAALAALKAQWQAEYEHCDHKYARFGDQPHRRCIKCASIERAQEAGNE